MCLLFRKVFNPLPINICEMICTANCLGLEVNYFELLVGFSANSSTVVALETNTDLVVGLSQC